MAYTTEESVRVSGVNTPPKSTWNKLHINDIELSLPRPASTGDVYQRLPELFDGIESGVGADAVRWAVEAADDSRYVEVRAHTVREEPVVVAVDANRGQVADTGVMVREGATARVVVVVTGTPPRGAASASVCRVWAERGAQVEVDEFVAAGDGTHLEAVGVQADDGAQVACRQYLLGGGAVAAGLAVNLAGDGSRLDLASRYVVGRDETLDVNHVARARGRNTREELHASGILSDNARKTLRETIDLVHGTRGSKGNESETVLVVGDDVVNRTLPVILCDEDDVQGNHGATIGSVSQEALGYLADRGLTQADAERLFMRAVFDDAMIHAGCPEAEEAVVARTTEVLGDEVAQELRDSFAKEA